MQWKIGLHHDMKIFHSQSSSNRHLIHKKLHIALFPRGQDGASACSSMKTYLVLEMIYTKYIHTDCLFKQPWPGFSYRRPGILLQQEK
ncbi:hypothetical protein RRG08_000195 [Elysia crispata]|uniref:Uncharacterized protein n=1 Tax=Elysia crispata TaxID=231223 RepID=A0AAE0YW12_9GAST|nr:hypothetical protein RRG08_000195 [Elysia crispata]